MELLLGRKEAAEYLNISPPKKIIDIATGTGSLAFELAKLGHQVTGIDTFEEALIRAEEKRPENLDLRFVPADATDLPFKDKEFDAAAISFALHDMSHQTCLKVLEEMKRVTKLKGQILVVEYNEPKKHWAAGLTYPLVKITESANYPAFIHRGLDNLLGEVNLKPSRKTTFGGVVQVVVIDR